MSEGEIILKERYGSSSHELLYVKPPDQTRIVVLHKNDTLSIKKWFTDIFMPQGYPDSVSKDYLAYQVWDTAQALCSTITGTLATQEVLRGVGVGNAEATPLAATITWVLKDGCGHMGRIFFAYGYGTHLDAYSKKWRLYADTLNDAAMCIEISLPYFKEYTTVILCISTVMRAIVGVAGGATRMAMTQHHATRGNLADVSAKDSAQETAVNLIGSFVALFIITVFGNSMLIFALMVILHIVCNYFAVRAVCLRTLNQPRYLLLIQKYLTKEVISTPCAINATEPIVFYQLGGDFLEKMMVGFKITLGSSYKNAMNSRQKVKDLSAIKDVYYERKYIIIPNVMKREMYVLLKEDAHSLDILCSYFHAVLLSIITCAINDHALPSYSNQKTMRPFAQVCEALQAAEWSREPMVDLPMTYTGFIHAPAIELQTYVDIIVQREWVKIKEGLVQTGWDVSKHLLIIDEWRVTDPNVKPAKPQLRQTTVETNRNNKGIAENL